MEILEDWYRIDGQSSSEPCNEDTAENMYIDIGFDKPGEVEKELEDWVQEELQEGLSEDGDKKTSIPLEKAQK